MADIRDMLNREADALRHAFGDPLKAAVRKMELDGERLRRLSRPSWMNDPYTLEIEGAFQRLAADARFISNAAAEVTRAIDLSITDIDDVLMREIRTSGSMSGSGKPSHGTAIEALPKETGSSSYAVPKATAPRLDSTHSLATGGILTCLK